MALSLVNANTFNAYTGSFQVIAFGSMWRRFRAESVAVRVIPFLCVLAAGTVIACYGYQQFVTNLSNFLDDLLVLFIPWSAVNLADYFLVRHGDYDVASFFTPDGAYGRFAWRGLLAYLTGLVAELPFVSQPDYTGWLVKPLGGADISWLVGWIIAAGVYLCLVPRAKQARTRGGRPPLPSASPGRRRRQAAQGDRTPLPVTGGGAADAQYSRAAQPPSAAHGSPRLTHRDHPRAAQPYVKEPPCPPPPAGRWKIRTLSSWDCSGSPPRSSSPTPVPSRPPSTTCATPGPTTWPTPSAAPPAPAPRPPRTRRARAGRAAAMTGPEGCGPLPW